MVVVAVSSIIVLTVVVRMINRSNNHTLRCIMNGRYQMLIYTFNWFMIGELSTVFLNVRWILIKAGQGQTTTFKIIQNLFALSFFITRIIIYTRGVYEWWIGKRPILTDIVSQGHVPALPMLSIACSILFGWLLNLFWFYKILMMGRGRKQHNTTTKVKKEEKMT